MKKIVMVLVLAAMLLSTFAAHAETRSKKLESKALFEMMLKMSSDPTSNVTISHFSHSSDGMMRIVLTMPSKNGARLSCTQYSTDTGDSVIYECEIH